MIINNPLIVEKQLDETYFITFKSNGVFYSGIVDQKLIPIHFYNNDTTTYEQWVSCFDSWIQYLNSKKNSFVTSEEEKRELLIDEILDKMKESKYLTFIGNKFYRLNNTVSLPLEIVEAYYKKEFVFVESIESLDNFWFWVNKNSSELKENIYKWLSHDNWTITEKGFLLVYRNVIKLNDNFKQIIKDYYYQVKNWKKSPKNYFLKHDGEKYIITKEVDNYNLQDLYEGLQYGNVFTHQYGSESDGQPRMFYKLLGETVLDRSLCDFSSNTCSKGIHATSKLFLTTHGMGDTILACLVNPMNIVSCPDGYNKMRVCALYPFAVVEDIDTFEETHKDSIKLANENYDNSSIMDLEMFTSSLIEDKNPKFIGVSKKEIKERMTINI